MVHGVLVTLRKLWYFILALGHILCIDVVMRHRGVVYLKDVKRRLCPAPSFYSIARFNDVCSAMARASRLYKGKSPCLVHSFATAFMLAKYAGAATHIVLGVTRL